MTMSTHFGAQQPGSQCHLLHQLFTDLGPLAQVFFAQEPTSDNSMNQHTCKCLNQHLPLSTLCGNSLNARAARVYKVAWFPAHSHFCIRGWFLPRGLVTLRAQLPCSTQGLLPRPLLPPGPLPPRVLATLATVHQIHLPLCAVVGHPCALSTLDKNVAATAQQWTP